MGKKAKRDIILDVSSSSPLVSEIYPEWEDEEIVDAGLEMTSSSDDEAMVSSGELGLGGNPVTITITDGVTGMEMELSHVKNALLVLEEQRKNSSGWLSLVIGDIQKVGDVL